MEGKPRPFTVAIPEPQLEDLRSRLRATRWPGNLGNEGWAYGVERGWLEEMVRYWAEDFDWRAQEREINQFPQFIAEIDGNPIHFIHVRGKGENPQPLILSHGWPWSFWDFSKIIGPLTDPAAFGDPSAPSFDVVVPSLPGMGFSPLTNTGLDARRIAGLWAKLMHEALGYEKFGAAGSDWGAGISTELGHSHPELLDGVWVSFPVFPGMQREPLTAESFAPGERWMFEQLQHADTYTQAHFTVGVFEPQTISYALADSPAGTAAWTWVRRRDSSDNDGDLLEVFDRDFLCTDASIHWLTGSIATSMRIYYEHFMVGPPEPLHDRPRIIDVPTGIGVFPKDNRFLPRAKAEEWCDLQRWEVMPRGGHFSFSEEPELCATELREFFGAL